MVLKFGAPKVGGPGSYRYAPQLLEAHAGTMRKMKGLMTL